MIVVKCMYNGGWSLECNPGKTYAKANGVGVTIKLLKKYILKHPLSLFCMAYAAYHFVGLIH